MGTTREDKIRERGTITFTAINLRDMEQSIKDKEFKTVTELVNTAIRAYYDEKNVDIDPEEVIENYFNSPKGDEKMMKLMLKALEMKLRGH